MWMIVILAMLMIEAGFRKCQFNHNKGQGLDEQTGSGVGMAQVRLTGDR